MRLRDIQQVLTDEIGALQIRTKNIDGSNDKEIHGSRRTLEAIEALKPTGIFQEEITKLLSVSLIVNNVRDPIVVPLPIYQDFHKTLARLQQRATVFLGVLNEFIGEQDPHSIGVRLPLGLDLKETAEIISDLDKLLQQALVNTDTNGTITLQGFDRGSEWLEIGLGSAAALAFFSRMVQFYFCVKEKGVEIEGKREFVREIKLKNDLKEAMNESLTQELETYQDQELKELLGDNNDLNGRIKFSVDSLKKLMDRGLQIQPSFSAPEEIKLPFSPPEQIEQVRQISSQQEEEEHTDQNSEE